MKHNDKGFTLVELIVVIAILGILAGILGMSIASVTATRARKAASAVNDMLSQCKVLTLSGGMSPYIRIHESSGSYLADFYTDDTLRASETLGGENLDLTFTTDSGVSGQAIPSGGLYLAFDRVTGALSDLDAGTVSGRNGALTGAITAITAGHYTVSITPSTGYHTIGD